MSLDHGVCRNAQLSIAATSNDHDVPCITTAAITAIANEPSSASNSHVTSNPASPTTIDLTGQRSKKLPVSHIATTPTAPASASNSGTVSLSKPDTSTKNGVM